MFDKQRYLARFPSDAFLNFPFRDTFFLFSNSFPPTPSSFTPPLLTLSSNRSSRIWSTFPSPHPNLQTTHLQALPTHPATSFSSLGPSQQSQPLESFESDATNSMRVSRGQKFSHGANRPPSPPELSRYPTSCTRCLWRGRDYS